MLLRRDYSASNLCPSGSVVTVGNFDGLHLGHRALIDMTQSIASERGLASALISFEPLAREYFSGDSAPPRIFNAGERIRRLAQWGLDLTWMLRFNEQLAKTSAGDFVRNFLVAGVNAKTVIVGEDFRFGNGRAGDVDLLHRMGAELGFEVQVPPTVLHGGDRISSTAVRAALTTGNLQRAANLLGEQYRMSGRVVYGQQLGRKLGFPTANIPLRRITSPVHGIYAVRVNGAGLENHPGVASVGTRPTVDGTEMLLEAHLFDFDGDLYGRRLCVDFFEKLRDEEKFESLSAMTQQMGLDAAQARSLLAA